jgi:hypothetical protein
MATFNNNGTITLSFEYKGKRFVLSGLGSYSDTKQLKHVKQTELRIKADCKANNFPFTDNESVNLFYFPNSEDRQQMIDRTIETERRTEKERSDLSPQLIADLQTRLAKRYSASSRTGDRPSTQTSNRFNGKVWRRGICGSSLQYGFGRSLKSCYRNSKGDL